jgi:uncharacterized protein YrrD
VEDLGAPSSYLELGKGTECFTSDGEKVGKVEHVLAVPEDDIFDGIILDTSVLPGGHRFVDAQQVEEIFDRGVLLKIDRKMAEALPEPTQNPAAMTLTADDLAESDEGKLKRKLHRAWELISGEG